MPPEAEDPPPAWRRLYPFELATLFAVATAVLFLRWRGLRIDWNTVRYTLPPMVPVTGQALLWGVPLYLLYLLLRRAPVRPYLRRILSLEWLQLWLRIWISYMWITYAYFWLKVSVPLVNPHLWDAQLWRADRILHLGISPSIFLTQLFAGTPLLGWIDLWYAGWLARVFGYTTFFCAFPDSLFRRRFILSLILLWILGAWCYTALPALGPCYALPEVWREFAGQLPKAEAAQRALGENYRLVTQGRSGPLTHFNPTRGIAALPSLHVAVPFLMMLWARRVARPLLLLFAIEVAFTFVGSLATGWHYAIDAYAGIALALLCYWLAGRLEPGVGPEMELSGAAGPPAPEPAGVR